MKRKIIASVAVALVVLVTTGARYQEMPSLFDKISDLSQAAKFSVEYAHVDGKIIDRLEVTRSRLRWDMTFDVAIKATATQPDDLVGLALYGADDRDGNKRIDADEWILIAAGAISKSDKGVVGSIDSASLGLYDAYCVMRSGANGHKGCNTISSFDCDSPQ